MLLLLVLTIIITFLKNIYMDEVLANCIVFTLVVSLVFSLITAMDGLSVYPYLAAKKEEIKVLTKRIEDIKNAYYEEKERKNAIIAGDIKNFQQSTNLSKYISDLAEKEAKFYKELKKAKVYKEVLVYRLFWKGAFISNKIYELE
ncbi:MAG: hypothetical protein ACTSQG_06310 [Promethearchaeota archaeon]